MEIEEIVEWAKRNFRHLNMARVLSYWFGWLACCTLGAIVFNVIAPSWLSWYDKQAYKVSFFVLFSLLTVTGITYGISRGA